MSNESTQDDALTHISEQSTQSDLVPEKTQGYEEATPKEKEPEVKSVTPVPPSPSRPKKENALAEFVEEPDEEPRTAPTPTRYRTSVATDFQELVGKAKRAGPEKTRSSKVLVWKNVQVEVEGNGGRFWRKGEQEGKVILSGVCGHARAGELTFIMGPSGAGKTTLLNVLTGRNKSGLDIKGDISMSNRPLTTSELRALSAYVQQEDVFLSSQTVSEVLHFAVEMRSPQLLPSAQRAQLVEQMLTTFGLKGCEHTRIGSPSHKGISRGEKKRLTIACEILTDPPILFCDEPTTGLDSFMSHQVMTCLKRVAAEGKVVVCTIHQPSTWVYQMADRLVLLCQGQVVYEGATRNVAGFLEKINYPVPEFASISDHFIRILSQSVGEKPKDHEQRIEAILSRQKPDDSLRHTPATLSLSHQHLHPRSIPRPWCFQFTQLVRRGMLQMTRRRGYVIGRLVLTVLVSYFLGMVYLQVPIDKDHLLGVKGVVFAALQMNNILYLMPSLISFWEDYHVVIRECQSNMYSPSAYFMARSLTDSVLHLIFPIVFFFIIYFITGLPITIIAMSTFLTMCIAMSMIITSLSHAVVSLCGNVNISLAVAPLFSVPAMVFGGFLITVNAVPWYYKPFGYISWYHYAFEAIMVAIFEHHGEIQGCSTSSLPKQFDFECSTGLKFIKDQDFKVSNYWWDFAAVWLILLFWKVFGLFSFVWRIRTMS